MYVCECVYVCMYVCMCVYVCVHYNSSLLSGRSSEQYSLDFMSIWCPWEGGLNLESPMRPVMVPSRGK